MLVGIFAIAVRADALSTDVAVLGDSVALGIGAWPEPGYPQLLAWMTGLSVSVFGRAGATSRDLLLGGYVEQVLAHRPHTVVVGVGGNDLLQLVDHEEQGAQVLAELAHNVGAILQRLEKVPRRVLLGVYNPFPRGHRLRPVAEHWLQAANAILQDQAHRHDAVFLPTASLFDGQEALLTRIRLGDVHPTLMGHWALAEGVFSLIQEDGVLLRLLLAPAHEIVYAQTVSLPDGQRLSFADAVGMRLLLHAEWTLSGGLRLSWQLPVHDRARIDGMWWAGVEIAGGEVRMRVSRLVVGTLELSASQGETGWALEAEGWLTSPWQLHARWEQGPSGPSGSLSLRLRL